MSADNWAKCPRCDRRHTKVAEAKRQEADAAYGKVSVDEWKRMDQAAINALEPLTEDTFREDYEIGIDEVGIVETIYRGFCSVCRLETEFKHEHRVDGIDE